MSFAAQEVRALGGYDIKRRLGAGGMAEVFLATQRMAGGVERTVVVKSILPNLASDESFVKMFLREARIAASLSHPNVVHIHDVAIIEGRACIVMEFLRGRDLSFVLRRVKQAGRRPPVTVAAAVCAQTATGLDYAHHKKDERGRPMLVVHRDISPHNLFVARDGHVRVLDFGIARSAHEQQLTDTDSLKGKLAYLAPEYIKKREVTAQLDQFAVGIVLWEALTGQRLFHRSDPLSTMQAVLEHSPPPPSSLVPGLPRELDEITLQALDRDPRGRFPDCGALASALRAWLRTADHRPDPEIVAEWLDEVVPPAEDAALYSPQVAPTRRPELEPTEIHASALSDAPTSSGVQGRKREPEAGRADVAPASRALEATVSLASSAGTDDVTKDRSPRRSPTSRVPLLVGSLAVAAIAGVALASLLPVGPPASDAPPAAAIVAPPPTVAPPPIAPAVEPPAPPAPPPTSEPLPAPVVPIEVRFTGGRGASISVDGVPVHGDVWAGPPSAEPHAVRVRWRDGRQREFTRTFDAPATIAVPAPPRPASGGRLQPGVLLDH